MAVAFTLVAAPARSAPPAPIGAWWTEDKGGVIRISPCGDELCGRIVGQDEPRTVTGDVPRTPQGTPHCGLMILRVSAAADGHWRGSITDPDDGTVWRCDLVVDGQGALRLRGYVLTPLFGATQVWPPFEGHLSQACDILP